MDTQRSAGLGVRIRQIKPTYFLDKVLWTRCRAETREFYQGLWLIADDAGWFEWDITSIATEIYRFVGVAKRERDAERHAEILEGLQPEDPHLILHVCGHAEVPKMPQHQRISEVKRVRTDFDRHLSGRCPAHPRGTPRDPAASLPGKEREMVRERNGMEMLGSADARVPDGRAHREGAMTSFGDAMARNGYEPRKVSNG